jgi:hypothetical protein
VSNFSVTDKVVHRIADLVVIDENPYHLVGAFHGPVRRHSHFMLYAALTKQPDTPYEGGYYEVVSPT